LYAEKKNVFNKRFQIRQGLKTNPLHFTCRLVAVLD